MLHLIKTVIFFFLLQSIYAQIVVLDTTLVHHFKLLSDTVWFGERRVKMDTVKNRAAYYYNRYGVSCLNEKITDNHGEGFESLYGTRNLRPILHGVAYRGGANNYYHRINPRSNVNPMPQDGIINIYREGFSQAVYLYILNFPATADMQTDSVARIHTLSGDFRYVQNSAYTNDQVYTEVMAVLNEM